MGAVTGAFVYPALRSVRRMRGSRDLSVPHSRLTGLTRAFAFAVVFIAGWYLCLPESEFVEMPWWAAKHAIGPNILVHEALFAVYLIVGGLRPVLRGAFRARDITLSASVCLVVLAAWCATASLLAPFPFHDAGRSARLVLMALLLLGVTQWASGDSLFVLRAFLLGLAGSALITLVLTFLNPVTAALIPRLLGQNSPGPPMGIAVCLAAWLILLSRSRRDTIMGMIVAVICGIGAMISYSKTGMLAAFMGFVSIAIVSGRVAATKRGRILVTSLFALVLGAASYLGGDAGRPIWTAFSGLVQEKVESARGESLSIQQRLSYWMGVGEIVVTHPIGVGYSGFRDAMMETEAYSSGVAVDESPIGADVSNPHAFFLYYASAGGLVGGGLAVAIFILLCRVLLRGLGLYGASGALLAVFCSVAYFVLAISIPYLFNSSVMLIPAAVTAGLWSHVMHAGADIHEGTRQRADGPR